LNFLGEPTPSAAQETLFKGDLDDDGFVWNVTRLWAHQPELYAQLAGIMDAVAVAAGLSFRDKAMLVLGTASTLGDSYCSIAWGHFLTEDADPATALAVLQRDERPLTDRERALLAWASKVVSDPNDATVADVDGLREVGFDDAQILALTLYGALPVAFSTTNDALGAQPDAALAKMLDPSVSAVITWGRAPA